MILILRLRLRFAIVNFNQSYICFFLKYSGFSPRVADSSSTGKANGGFVSVQYAGNPSASEPGGSYTGPVLARRLPKYVVVSLSV